MKFTEFRTLVEEYKQALIDDKKDQAELILNKLDPNNLGLKRFFVVKKHRVEKVVEKYCEENNLKLKYRMENITNKNYDFIIVINDSEEYKIRCQTKKAVGYVHLRSLYRDADVNDGLDLLIKAYPEIEEGIWNTVLDTANEQKRRELFSINARLMRNNENEEKSNMVIQLTKDLEKRKQQIIDSLQDIEIGETNIKKI